MLVVWVGCECLGRVFLDESDDYVVEVEEEYDQMEIKFEEGFLCRLLEKLCLNDGYVVVFYFFVDVEFVEDFGCVEKVSVVDDFRI